jgi:hypothetical protein
MLCGAASPSHRSRYEQGTRCLVNLAASTTGREGVNYKLLSRFRALFEGQKYLHRRSNAGDQVASFLYDDMFELGRSPKFVAAVQERDSVINIANVAVGRTARRGDGSFGERVPNVAAVVVPDHLVAFGSVAAVDVGIEVKILAKAMIKQLDRVGTDMINQAAEFRRHGGNPICVGIVGINRARTYVSFEGTREWPTDGRKTPHPFQEAEQAERRLVPRIQPLFDEVIVLRYRATNIDPFPFEWVDAVATETEYAANLLRISREYEKRF